MSRCSAVLLTIVMFASRAQAKPHVELGLGYSLWNERVTVTQGGVHSAGYAGFGGFAALLEVNWTKHRWQWGWNTEYGLGKASLGGATPEVPEGNDRPWFLASGAGFAHYRLNPNFMVGAGALFRYRGMDWTVLAKDTAIESGSRIQATGFLSLRWKLERWTLSQTFAPLDFAGDSLWQWTVQYTVR